MHDATSIRTKGLFQLLGPEDNLCGDPFVRNRILITREPRQEAAAFGTSSKRFSGGVFLLETAERDRPRTTGIGWSTEVVE